MNLRKLVFSLFVVLLISGCAGSTARKAAEENSEHTARITVENLVGKGISVYYREPLNPYLFLGYVPVGEKRTFEVKGPFYETRFSLLAKPNFGAPLSVSIPVGLQADREITWVAEYRNFVKLEVSEPEN